MTDTSEETPRYFTNRELRCLFHLDNPKFSSTQRHLEEHHAHQRHVYPEMKLNLDFLHTLDIFGISDHDLLFQGQIDDSMEQDDRDQESIRSMVKKAELLLQLESDHVHNLSSRSHVESDHVHNLRSRRICKDLTNVQKTKVKSTAIGDTRVLKIKFPSDDKSIAVNPQQELEEMEALEMSEYNSRTRETSVLNTTLDFQLALEELLLEYSNKLSEDSALQKQSDHHFPRSGQVRGRGAGRVLIE